MHFRTWHGPLLTLVFFQAMAQDAGDQQSLIHRENQFGDEIERKHIQALREAEMSPGEDKRIMAASNNLGLLYYNRGRYGEAQPLLERAVALSWKVPGVSDQIRVRTLKNLGLVFLAQGRYGDAERVLKRSLSTAQKMLGQEHAETLSVLQDSAAVAYHQRQYTTAERLYGLVLAAREKS